MPSLERKALALLARREHSARELTRKLLTSGAPTGKVAKIVAELARKDLLSDARFAEGLVRQRLRAGYGPIRIRQALREKGVAPEIVTGCLSFDDATWIERAFTARRKRFGASGPRNSEERLRQARFLQYRGFTSAHISTVLERENSTTNPTGKSPGKSHREDVTPWPT